MAAAGTATRGEARAHFEGLDALRGLAALLVLCHHIDASYPALLLFRHAYLGVDIFFMLSGFVISYVYEGRLASGTLSLRDYARIRLVRLYPLIALSVLLGAAHALYVGAPSTRVVMLIAAQLIMLPVPRAGVDAFPLNGPQWSLFYELAVNTGHAIVSPLLTTRRVAVVVAASACLFAAAIFYEGSASVGAMGLIGFAAGAPRAIFGFFTGILIFRLRSAGLLAQSVPAGWLAYPAVFIGAIFPGLLLNNAPSVAADMVCVFLIYPASVWAAAGLRVRGGLRRIARWMGLVSFPLYAVQQPTIESIVPVLPGEGPSKPVVWVALAVALCLLAWLVEIGFDAPVRRWFKRNRAPREGAAATAP